MSEVPLLRVRALQRSYGTAFRLNIGGLEVGQGEILCLLGPTGAGKSTLLRLLAGLEEQTSGEILFKDRPFATRTLPLDLQRRITLVHQRPLLLRGTVRHNVEYGLRVRKRPPAIDDVLERLDVHHLARQSAQKLSGGQTQLVALARAIAVEPDLLLLDEPTAHLDPAHVALVEAVIRERREANATTVVWATHNLFQARRVADRVALLLGGELVEVAPAQTFFESPADPRTTDFVQGKMIY